MLLESFFNYMLSDFGALYAYLQLLIFSEKKHLRNRLFIDSRSVVTSLIIAENLSGFLLSPLSIINS